MFLIIAITIWLVFGILAYGLTLGYFSEEYPNDSHVKFSLFMAIIGPIGLVVAVFYSLADTGRLKFQIISNKN